MNDLTIKTIIIASIILLSMRGNSIRRAEDMKGFRITNNKSLPVELVENLRLKTLLLMDRSELNQYYS